MLASHQMQRQACVQGSRPLLAVAYRRSHLGSVAAPPLQQLVRSRTTAVQARRTKTATFTEEDEAIGIEISADEKIKRLMTRMNARFEKGTLVQMDGKYEPLDTTPSGCLDLDIALGGGYPKGRIVEIYGPESSGKSTLALHAIAECQKAGGAAVYIDVEHAFDKTYAQNLGVDVGRLMIGNPTSGEVALELVDELARSNVCNLVVVDSVSALVPKAELDGDIGQMLVGAQARLMSQGLRKLCGSVANASSKISVIFINQVRNKVGVIYGSPETTSGGNALKYYASVRIDLRKKEQISGEGGASAAPIGIKVRAKMVKNKCAPPYREATFDILFGSGIDAVGGMVDAAESSGVLVRRGAYYYLESDKLAQGRDKTIARLRDEPLLRTRIEQLTRAKMSAGEVLLPGADEDADFLSGDLQPDDLA